MLKKITYDKRLKFVLPKKLNTFGTFIDVHWYIRKLNIQQYFITNPMRQQSTVVSRGTVYSGLSSLSLFIPPGPTAPSINVFHDFVLKALENLPIKRTRNHPDIRVGLSYVKEKM